MLKRFQNILVNLYLFFFITFQIKVITFFQGKQVQCSVLQRFCIDRFVRSRYFFDHRQIFYNNLIWPLHIRHGVAYPYRRFFHCLYFPCSDAVDRKGIILIICFIWVEHHLIFSQSLVCAFQFVVIIHCCKIHRLHRSWHPCINRGNLPFHLFKINT